MHNTLPGPGNDVQRELQEARARIEQQRERIKKQDARIERLQGRLSDGKRSVRATNAEDLPVFFLFGRAKSGTGWLMRLLNFHPEVMCRGEGRFFGREMRAFGLRKMQATGAVNTKIAPSSLYNAIAYSEWLRLWMERSVWARNDDPEEHIDNLTRMAIDYFLKYQLSKTKKRIVGDKTPLPGPEVIREISVIHPNAKVIHIVRDGRDQAVSQMHHIWRYATDKGGPHNLDLQELAKRDAYAKEPQKYLESGEGIFTEERLQEIAREWANRSGATAQDGPALLGGNYAEVKYEDLLERPEEEARRLFGFLGVDTKDRIVRRCVKSASFEKLSGGKKRGQEDSSMQWRKYRKGVAGDWKNVFTERDKEIFKEEAGDLLVKLGYERNHDW